MTLDPLKMSKEIQRLKEERDAYRKQLEEIAAILEKLQAIVKEHPGAQP